MSRPTTLLKDNVLKWVIRLYDSSQVLVDGDSNPTITIRKNGASTAAAATVTKRSATTGIYDCEYDPSGEVEGDQFTIEESVAISSTTYENSWSVYVQQPENSIAATDIVSNGAITTLAGAVVNVDTVDTTTTNSDMRGTDNASTFDHTTDEVTTDAASRTASQADVSSLATAASITALNDLSQADVRTAVGLASANLDTQLADIPTVSEFEARTLVAAEYFDPASDTVANVTTVAVCTTNTDMRGTDGANTIAPVDVSTDVAAILADTNELQTNQNNWLTATGFSTHSASDVASLVLVTPANKLATDASGNIEANNMRGTDGANTVAPDNTSIADILADTNELQTNQGDWATADVSSLATQASVDGLNDISVADILASGDIDGYNIEEALKLCLAVLAGKISGAGTTTILIRAADDSKDRITATVDSNGNRSSISIDTTG